MDPGTGNVYTNAEATRLGLERGDLIELEEAEALRILDERIAEANALTATPWTPPASMSARDKARRRARRKASRRSRKANR